MATIPSAVTGLRVTRTSATTIALVWNAPKTGTTPFHYEVRVRRHGATWWTIADYTSATSTLVSPLAPLTTYDVEVLAYNT